MVGLIWEFASDTSGIAIVDVLKATSRGSSSFADGFCSVINYQLLLVYERGLSTSITIAPAYTHKSTGVITTSKSLANDIIGIQRMAVD